MPPDAIVTSDLRRTYAIRKGVWRTQREQREALRGITLTIPSGELFGLLGPNGAGKTTLVKILSTILLPTAGSASIFGQDIVQHTAQVRRRARWRAGSLCAADGAPIARILGSALSGAALRGRETYPLAARSGRAGHTRRAVLAWHEAALASGARPHPPAAVALPR